MVFQSRQFQTLPYAYITMIRSQFRRAAFRLVVQMRSRLSFVSPHPATSPWRLRRHPAPTKQRLHSFRKAALAKAPRISERYLGTVTRSYLRAAPSNSFKPDPLRGSACSRRWLF